MRYLNKGDKFMKRLKEVVFLSKYRPEEKFTIELVESAVGIFHVREINDSGNVVDFTQHLREGPAIRDFHRLIGETVMEGHSVSVARNDL